MSETQVLRTVSDFLFVFACNHLSEGGFTFQWGAFILKLGEGAWGWESTSMQRFSKNQEISGHAPPL